MDLFEDQLLALFAALNKHNVSYLLVGGFASNYYGAHRFTADVDLWLKDTEENRHNLRKALEELGYGDLEPLQTMEFVAGWTSILLDNGYEIDLMTNLVNYDQLQFDECLKMASHEVYHDIPIHFIHYNHLIAEKKKAGRPKDLLDVEELEKIRKLQ